MEANLPIEIVNKIMLYVSTPTADCIKELLSRFNKNPDWIDDKKLYSDIKVINAILVEERASNSSFDERWSFNPYPDEKCYDGFNYGNDNPWQTYDHRLAHPYSHVGLCCCCEEYSRTSDVYVK